MNQNLIKNSLRHEWIKSVTSKWYISLKKNKSYDDKLNLKKKDKIIYYTMHIMTKILERNNYFKYNFLI